jgi:hypothetical protein
MVGGAFELEVVAGVRRNEFTNRHFCRKTVASKNEGQTFSV